MSTEAEFLQAIEANDAAGVDRALNSSAGALLKTPGGKKAVSLALEREAWSIAQELVKTGFPLTVPDRFGRPPLIQALTLSGSPPKLIAAMLGFSSDGSIQADRSALANKGGGDGVAPLELALKKGSALYAELLVKAGAKVDLKGGGGQTMLAMAMGLEGDQARLIRAMLGLSEDKGSPAPKGPSPGVNQRSYNESLPLQAALELGRFDYALLLVKAGAIAHFQGSSGATLLAQALRAKKAPRALIRAMAGLNEAGDPIASGAPVKAVNERCYQERLPLQVALEAGRLDFALDLAKAGAKGHLQCSTGPTALGLALKTAGDGAELIQELVKKEGGDLSAAVNQRSYDERLPLQVALEAGRADYALILAKAGARGDFRASSGSTAMAMALRAPGDNRALIRALAGLDESGEPLSEGWVSSAANERGYDERLPLQVALEAGRLDYALDLAKAGAKAHLKGSGGATGLALALKTKGAPLALIKALIRSPQGESPALNQRSYDERLPLQVALEHGRWDCALELARAGARAELKGSSGDTPISVALRAKEDHLDVVRAMLGLDESGAPPSEGWISPAANQRSYDERLPLQVAIESNRADYVHALLEAGAKPKLKASSGQTLDLLAEKALGANAEATELIRQARDGSFKKMAANAKGAWIELDASESSLNGAERAGERIAENQPAAEAPREWPLGVKRRCGR